MIEYANSVDTISQLRLGKASRERVNFAQLLAIMLFKQVNHPLYPQKSSLQLRKLPTKRIQSVLSITPQ